ncbi:MAG: glycosyltransferase family 2 protein [Pyrinomonadaceae bacterium]
MQISAVIITFNEEAKIADALRSVAWADEILVIDSNSADRTVEIARAMNAKVIVRDWPGFSEQKQFGSDSATHDWIFSLDADERVTPKLQTEIEAIKNHADILDGYATPRLSIYMGREIRHSGWHPDRQLRFFNRRKGSWNRRPIHESVIMHDGATTGKLHGEILHYSVDSAAHHHKMIGERYAPLAAKHMFDNGRRTTAIGTAIAGPAAFIRSYILKAGFLDGFPGFCIAAFAAYHSYLKHLMLWELQNAKLK